MAQKNGSVMWQDVISFDNAWLKANGLYNSETGWISTTALQHAVREGMRVVVKQEELKASMRWTASIHYNTDHVHTSMWPQPTRVKQMFKDKETGEMYEACRGARKKSTLDKFKSTGANALLNRDQNWPGSQS